MSASDPDPCEVFWGSHGCDLPRGHDGYCRCDCADDEDAVPLAEGGCNVGAYPYYGPETILYGRDVREAWGLDGDVRRSISESPWWQKDHRP